MVNANISTHTDLDLVYDGPSLADGSMNVRDLAPALMAIGSFFDDANRIVNGPNATIGVNVRATAPGSFEILFQVTQTAGSSGILPGDVSQFISTAADLKELLVGIGSAGTVGLIWLIKQLRGRNPKITKINDEVYTLTVDDKMYEVPLRLLRLYQDIKIRRNIEDMIKPLREPGIDVVHFRERDSIIQSISKKDIPSFTLPDEREVIIDKTTHLALSLVSVVFKEGNKWRLTDGTSEFLVTIKDERFLKDIDEAAVTFSKRDILVCELRTIQWQTFAGLITEHEVLKVLEHRTARQLMLLSEEPTENF